ncbi:unnamed protein product [Heligmosomoides polygyrus]|uniref:MARVEL domain-containing protein n=1 Tax=Heligmosomoides polygyrus TaxID=6339 RepID=A0A183G209_HELPZ|nr:unnamed protein product [Heligmosomoides polygyrus]
MVLGAVITVMEIVCYLLLPTVPRWIFVASAVVSLLVLIAGVTTLQPTLLAIFIVLNLLLEIPVFVVIYFTTFTLCSYSGSSLETSTCQSLTSNYQCWLYKLPIGLLWTGLIFSFLTIIVDGVLTTAVRKVRLLAQGVTTIIPAPRDCCHYPRPPVVVEVPQLVYTTTANVTYPISAISYSPERPSSPSHDAQSNDQYRQHQVAPIPPYLLAPPEYKP